MSAIVISINPNTLSVCLEQMRNGEYSRKLKSYPSSKEVKKTVFTLLELLEGKDEVSVEFAEFKPVSPSKTVRPAKMPYEWVKFIKALFFSKYHRSILVGRECVDEDFLDELDDDLLRFYEDCANRRLLEENVKLINKLGLRPELRKRTVDEFKQFLELSIQDSGYDVDMSSAVQREGLSVYKFYDGSSMVEGIRKHSKMYESYAHTLHDLLMMFQSVQYYKSVGFEPELEHEREVMLRRSAVAKGIEFNVPDFAGIDDITLDEVRAFLDGDDAFEWVTPISACGLSVQGMLG